MNNLLLCLIFAYCLASPSYSSIIWTNFGDGTISSASNAGSGVSTIVTNVDSPFAVTSDSRHLYWADSSSNMIRRGNVDGSEALDFIFYGSGTVSSLQVTDTSLFWTQGSGSTRSTYYSDLNGQNVTSLSIPSLSPSSGIGAIEDTIFFPSFNSISTFNASTNTTATIIDSLLSTPKDIEVAGNYIYWSYLGSDDLMRANIDGTSITKISDTGTSIDKIAVDNQYIYWIAFGNSIVRSDLDGTNQLQIHSEHSIAGLTASVPEPSSSILVGFGSVCLMFFRKRSISL